MRRRLTLWAFIVLCVVGGLAQDADTAHIDSMHFELRHVTVYGQRPYAEVIPAQRLGGKQLEVLSSHSVADAIRYFSGVQLKDYGGVGGLKTVDIRSMGSNHMGVFYDGIQLGNAQNGQVDLGKFSLDNIEEVALYNGQKSDIFQSARDFGSAGSIYLRTRYPKFATGKRDNVNVTMRTGSFCLANPSVRWEHKLSPNVSLSLNSEYTYASGQYHFRYRRVFSDGTLAWDTTAVRKNGDLHAFRAEGGVFGASNDTRWNAKVYYYDSERGIPGAIVNNVWKRAQRQWDRNFFTQGSWQHRVSDRYSTMANVKYARDYLRYLNPDTTLLLVDNEFWQDEIYVSTANKLTILPDWEANLSVDYQWNYLNATLVNFVYPTRHTLLTAVATAYTWRGLKMQASGLYTMVNDRHSSRQAGTTVQHHSNHLHRLTPAVFVSWQPWQQHDLNVRAFYKRIFRMPTFNDLYYTDIGNANLRPEYATQYNIGAQWQWKSERGLVSAVRLSADAYYNRIDDKIIAIPTGSGQYRWTMMNIGQVRIRGIDVSTRLSLRLPAGVALDGTLNYTYQRAQDYSNPEDDHYGGSYKGQIAYIPWHSGSAIVNAAWRQLTLNYSFIYVGERYHTSANIPVNHEQPWCTHDLSASYAFSWGAVNGKATAEVNNLLNQQYDVILNFPMPGRNYRLTLKFDF
ncbi:MAG: TonB-dependent receptor [Muribaculaceae bacterium]|nr:TonB-dependent receptor [Muribaculaceae bacterium]